MEIDSLLERIDLIGPYALLTFLGAFASMYIMQKGAHDDEMRGFPEFMIVLRRWSWGFLSMGLFWCLTYASGKNWQPWPPMVGLLVVLDFNLFMKIVALHYGLNGRLIR